MTVGKRPVDPSPATGGEDELPGDKRLSSPGSSSGDGELVGCTMTVGRRPVDPLLSGGGDELS